MFSRTCLYLLLFLFAYGRMYSQTASIRGNVFDQVSRDGLAGASVTISNTPYRKIADDKGNFEFRGLPAGQYDVVISTVGYTQVTHHVILKAGQSIRIYIGLPPEGKALEEVTVFGAADREKETGSRDRERSAANMLNVISSQAMVRSPDISGGKGNRHASGY